MGFGAERSSDPLPSACARGSVACLISVSQVFYCTCRAACWSCRSSFFFYTSNSHTDMRIKLPCQACERHLTSPSETLFFPLFETATGVGAVHFTDADVERKGSTRRWKIAVVICSLLTDSWVTFRSPRNIFWSFAAKLFGSVQLNNWSGWGICLIHKRKTPKNTRNLSGSV